MSAWTLPQNAQSMQAGLSTSAFSWAHAPLRLGETRLSIVDGCDGTGRGESQPPLQPCNEPRAVKLTVRGAPMASQLLARAGGKQVYRRGCTRFWLARVPIQGRPIRGRDAQRPHDIFSLACTITRGYMYESATKVACWCQAMESSHDRLMFPGAAQSHLV